jgi:DNA polymerase-3 subunit chi
MGAAYFYHLMRSPLEDALPPLLRRSLAAGWRVELRGTTIERMAWLDEKLWLGADNDFLPHGLAGGPHDRLQPILLGTSDSLSPGIDCLMAVDGARVDPEEAASLERLCVLFDGGDATAVQAAREQWKSLTTAGLAAQYWAQEDSGWTKKSESAAKD